MRQMRSAILHNRWISEEVDFISAFFASFVNRKGDTNGVQRLLIFVSPRTKICDCDLEYWICTDEATDLDANTHVEYIESIFTIKIDCKFGYFAKLPIIIMWTQK